VKIVQCNKCESDNFKIEYGKEVPHVLVLTCVKCKEAYCIEFEMKFNCPKFRERIN
jgi:hypothetical protein